MERPVTYLRFPLLPLLGVALAAPLFAQTPPPPPARPREMVGDTVVVRTFNPAKLDTITVLFRAIERERYGSTTWMSLSHKLDSIVQSEGLPGGDRIFIRGRRPAEEEAMPRGWIGFNAQGPSRRIIDDSGLRVTYFAYPSILSVDPTSPADRAGIVPGDVLVAFNGTDVVGHEFNLTKLFAPEKRVAVTVRRDGESKDFSLDVVRAPEGVSVRRVEFNRMIEPPLPPMPPGGTMHIMVDKGDREEGAEGGIRRAATIPRLKGMTGMLMAGRFAVISPRGVFGADVSPVGPDLAKALKLEKGMLVNEVPEESPAYKAGLRAGDVIVSATGQPVTGLSQLQDQVLSRLADRSVMLRVMRNHKPNSVSVTW